MSDREELDKIIKNVSAVFVDAIRTAARVDGRDNSKLKQWRTVQQIDGQWWEVSCKQIRGEGDSVLIGRNGDGSDLI